MAGKNTVNVGFESQIWDAACVLWGHIPAAEYRNIIIGLIFLRYISTAFEKKYAPHHPAADAQGYVSMPNVNPLIEMMDMKEAQRAYEANLTMVQTARDMNSKVLDILK